MKIKLFALLSLLSIGLHAQCDLITPLKQEGFENLIQNLNGEDLHLHYENRRYRFEGLALKRVLEIISKAECLNENITLIIYNKGVPVTEITTKKSSIDALVAGEISPEDFNHQAHFNFTTRKRPKQKTVQSSYFKSDLAVGVRTDYLIGNFDNPIRWTPMLLPSLQTTITKGTQINATYGAVLYDDFYYWETSRFRYAFASHNGRLPGGIFTRVSAGYFESTQYGIEGHATKFFWGDQLRIDLNLSLTENRFLDAPPTRRAIDKNHFSYGIKTSYRYDPLTTDISLHYGRYIFDDTGYTFMLRRQFNEVFIGFYLREVDQQITGSFGTQYDRNYGFQFIVPIGTKKHLKPGYLRPKTDEQYLFRFNYTGGVGIGRRIDAPGTVIAELEEYYPSTLQRALESLFKGA